MPSYIETFTGKRFFPLSPDPADVCIEDIAHALSNQCRFAGHVKSFYSVGEHSIHVANLLADQGHPVDIQLWGLLHDASEAYLVDLPTSLKSGEFGETYRRAEDRLMRAITCKFELIDHRPTPVHIADEVMLSTEAHALMKFDERNWAGLPAPLPAGLPRLGEPANIERLFLHYFKALESQR